MTLVAAWLRTIGAHHELVIASDSRLSGNAAVWDCCPKIVTLPRSDAVLAFAGATDIAYPAMLQIARVMEAHPDVATRRYDITYVAKTVEDVLNQMLDVRVVDPVALEQAHLEKAGTPLLLCGWSWRLARFYVWQYNFSVQARRYRRAAMIGKESGLHQVWVGDAANAARKEFNRRRREAKLRRGDPLDMEPFEVLRDTIRNGSHASVGGAPQMVKVYRHMNVDTLGVLWRSSKDDPLTATYGGRPLLDFERPYFWFIDADHPQQLMRVKFEHGLVPTQQDVDGTHT